MRHYYGELNVKQQNFVWLFYFANITVTEIDLDNAIWNIDFKIRCSNTRATFVKALTRHGGPTNHPMTPHGIPMHPTALNYFIVFINWMLNYTRVVVYYVSKFVFVIV